MTKTTPPIGDGITSPFRDGVRSWQGTGDSPRVFSIGSRSNENLARSASDCYNCAVAVKETQSNEPSNRSSSGSSSDSQKASGSRRARHPSLRRAHAAHIRPDQSGDAPIPNEHFYASLQKLSEIHAHVPAQFDDSRESIYEGRGE